MPWREYTRMSQRSEFLAFAQASDVNLSQLSRQFGISRKTAYKWLGRANGGWQPLEDHSRRPLRSPNKTPLATEALVCDLRLHHPAWGGRKLRRRLQDQGVNAVPAPSTITGILRRNGLLDSGRRQKRDWQRFEEAVPNRTWQMDFKGHFPAGRCRCHPLTVIDDYSRFNLCLAACPDERRPTVQEQLTAVFRRYGLPERILTDNGPPWAATGQAPHTRLSAWLIRNGISVIHGHPFHPQTQGKDERFHRTLQVEVILRRPAWHDLEELQSAFDAWRRVYNFERPHDALGLQTPASRYEPSRREFSASLPEIEYWPGDEVRRVRDGGLVKFKGRLYRVGKAFLGEPVALRSSADGVWDVYYCQERIRRIDLTEDEAEV